MTTKFVLTLVFGAILILTGTIHFLKPKIYFRFIPDFLPKNAINTLAGLVEIVLGIGVFIPDLRYLATLGILLLMLAFLPIHAIDVFRERPAIGSHWLAIVRLPLQFVLIWWAYSICTIDFTL
jgi:uncharacterized membrane protein